MSSTAIDNQLDEIVARLLFKYPFFGSIACAMSNEQVSSEEEAKEKYGHAIDTMATDGRKIIWNESFFQSMDKQERQYVVAHEILHVVLKHHIRMMSREPKRWNIACDIIINGMLDKLNASLFKRPGGFNMGQYDDAGIYEDMSEESIYDTLVNVKDEDLPDACIGTVLPMPGGTNAAHEENRIDSMAQAAAVNHSQNDSAGNLPGFLADFVEETKKVKVNWKHKLREFFEPVFPTNYSWNNINKRGLAIDMVLPGLDKTGTGEIVIAVDVSGSVYHMANQFLSEVQYVIEQVKPLKTYVLWFHSTVFRVDEFDHGMDFRIPDNMESGGTCFLEVFKTLKERQIHPACFVMLTDLYPCDGYPNEAEVPYPCLWATCNEEVAPFGETIMIPPDKEDR